MATKKISKSIRVTDEVNGYIMEAPGKTFNEKFENIILEAKVGEAKRVKRLSDLQRSIDEQQRKLYKLFERYRYLDDFFKRFVHMSHTLADMQELLDKVMDEPDQETSKK